MTPKIKLQYERNQTVHGQIRVNTPRLVRSEKLSNCAKGQTWMGDRPEKTGVITFTSSTAEPSTMGTGRNVRTRQHEGVHYEDRHARGIGFLSMSKKRQTNEERSYQTRSTYPFFRLEVGLAPTPTFSL